MLIREVDSTVLEKKALRKTIQEQLKGMDRPTYEHLSYLITSRLFETTVWKEATIIAVTISRMPEVDTFQIIRKAWEEKKQVVVPKCHPEERRMTFHTLTAFNQLESVYYGLLEPIEKKTTFVHTNDIDLVLVPGLGYTRQGHRIGFGGGYYDRYLQNYKGNKLALAFTPQIVQELPIEEHDMTVNTIITEKETIEIYG